MTTMVKVQPWPATIACHDAAALRREVRRAHRAGELAAVGPVYQLQGRFAVDVLRLKDRHAAPAWRTPVLVVGGTLLVLVAAAAAGWWLSLALAPVVLPVIAALALISTVGRLLVRPGRCTIIHMRHR